MTFYTPLTSAVRLPFVYSPEKGLPSPDIALSRCIQLLILNLERKLELLFSWAEVMTDKGVAARKIAFRLSQESISAAHYLQSPHQRGLAAASSHTKEDLRSNRCEAAHGLS